jgi:hypothetical protein
MGDTGRMPSTGHQRGGPARPLAAAGLVLLLLVAAAAALPEGFSLARPTEPFTVVVPDLPAAAAYLALACAAVLLSVWAVLEVTAIRRGERERARSVPVWVQIVIVLAALLLPAVVGERGPFAERERAAETREAADRGDAGDARERTQRSRTLGLLATALLGVVLVALVAGSVWLFWPQKDADVVAAPTEVVLERLRTGLDDLETIDDPRRAVLACYGRMEELLEVAGLPRRPSDTPTELLQRVLVDHHAARASVTRLTELFERARFSPHRIDDSMRRDALDALRAVHDQIGALV